ncbi:hypothetical protein [Singulisphaera sp. PoT]|uniref:hypothetical protein n=1 Tax=Singulisphaera sp. PoT TaxID=3411797 RepID=UPI003BF54EAA
MKIQFKGNPTIGEWVPGFALEELAIDLKSLHAVPRDAIAHPERAVRTNGLEPKSVAKEYTQARNWDDDLDLAAEVLPLCLVIGVYDITLTAGNNDKPISVRVLDD